MEIANARLVQNKVGSDVPVYDITPAQAMFLHILHGATNGGKTFGEEFKNIVVSGEAMVEADVPDQVEPDKTIPATAAVGKEGEPNYKPAVPQQVIKGKVISTKKGLRPRTDVEELSRLRRLYAGARDKNNKPIIDSIWPDRFNPKLPQKFSDINWQEAGSTGIEAAPLNYATGGLVTTSL